MSIWTLNEKPGRTAIVNSREYLFFSGYSYLGMQCVPEFIALVKEGIDKYGWEFPSSRISNTRLELYEKCEALLSAITRKEDTVLVSSGFTAGRMATEKWKEVMINLDPSHPAIKRSFKKTIAEEKIFAVDSVDVLAAAITDFSFAEKDNNFKTIIIDDSHGIGVIGKNGEGIVAQLPKNNHTDYIITYSLSKAFNIPAGAVSCSKSFAEELCAMPAYTAGTAPSPALLYAFMKGQDLYAVQRNKLKKNIQHMQSLIGNIDGIACQPDLSVFILPDGVNEHVLFEQGIIISSFAYPDPAGKKIQRVVINALHTEKDLEQLAKVLHQVLRS